MQISFCFSLFIVYGVILVIGCHGIETPIFCRNEHSDSSSTHPDKNVKTEYIIQLTDIHLDQYYVQNGDRTTRCRASLPSNGCPLYGDRGPHFSNGSWVACGTPVTLLNATFQMLENLVGNCSNPPKFILWTGDSSAWSISLMNISWNTELVASKIQSLLSSLSNSNKTKVYPTIGNNDVPYDCFGPNNYQTILSLLGKAWQPFLTPQAFQQFTKYGYYADTMKSDQNSFTILISLNTMLWSQRNPSLSNQTCVSGSDIGSIQMDWFEGILSSFTTATFYIIGHVPPIRSNGNKIYWPACQQRYEKLASKYQKQILAHIYGDVHYDEFEILSNQAATIFMAPSFHPTFNPAIRFWEVSHKSLELLNYFQYFASLDALNNAGNNSISNVSLQLEYSPLFPFNQSSTPGYGLSDLSVQSWINLQSQINNGGVIQQLYQKYRSVSWNGTSSFNFNDEINFSTPLEDQSCGTW